jgi:sec-independent protein translocase protein TatA
MFGEISLPKLIVILVILLLIFGPSRMGDLGSSLGKGIKGFRKAMKEIDENDEAPSNEEARQIEETNLDTSSKTTRKEEPK